MDYSPDRVPLVTQLINVDELDITYDCASLVLESKQCDVVL